MIRLFMLCLILMSHHALANETARVYGYNIKASTYVDSHQELRGKNHGGRPALLTELVRELMMALNITPDISPVASFVPPKQLDLKAAQAIFGIERTASNETQYKWVGPLVTASAYFVVSKDSNHTIQSIDDARSVSSLCVHRDSAQVPALKKMGFDNLYLDASYEECWQRVADGESELTIISEMLFPAIKKSVGLVATKVAKTDVIAYEDEDYLAFSNATPDATVEQWSNGLEKIKASAQYHSLIHHYYCQQNCF